MAVLPQENIQKMKLWLLLNSLLIFVPFFSLLRAVQFVASSHWWISLAYLCFFFYFIFLSCGTVGCNMHLCQKIFAILILCQAEIIKKRVRQHWLLTTLQPSAMCFH